jgi:transposase InsO family protein
MDVIGPLPETRKKNRYIITFTDHFSKWVEAEAIPDQTAETVARVILEQIICRHGAPERFLSDQGRNFSSKMIEALLEGMKVKAIYTAVYHPKANGITERFNKTLVDILAHYVNEEHKDWDEYLEMSLFAYRTSVHDSTGVTPFFLIHGQEATISEELGKYPQSTNEYGYELVKRLAETIQRVQY